MDYREAAVDIRGQRRPRSDQGAGRGTFNALGAHRDRVLRRHVPLGPGPLQGARCWVASTTGVGTSSSGQIAAGVHDQPSATTWWRNCVNDILRPGRGTALLSRLHRARQDGPREGRADRGGFLARLPRVRLPVDRWRDGRRCRAPTPRTTTTSRLHRRRRGRSSEPCRVACARADALLGLPLGRAAHQRLLAGAQGAVRGPRPFRRHAARELGTTLGQAPARPASQLSRRPRTVARARQDRALVHVTAAASRATSPACCLRAWASACAAAPGRCLRCSG